MPEFASAVQIIARNLVSSEDGDEVTYTTGSEDKQVKRIMDDLDQRTQLPHRTATFAAEKIGMGDAFIEIVCGTETRPLIWGLHELPTPTIVRKEDRGRVDEFCQIDSSGGPIVHWEPWEIMHLRYQKPFASCYGRSIFWPVRRVWKQLAALEDSTVIMVLERAPQVRVHTVPVSANRNEQSAQINDYKVRNRRKRSWNSNNSTLASSYNPMDSAEVIVPVPIGMDQYPPNVGVTTLDGQANFKEVTTVSEYFQRKCLMPLGVPPSYMGLEKDTRSRAINTAQEIEFGRMLRQIQSGMANAYKQNIYGLQLRFAYGGDRVDPKDYWIEFPRPSKVDDKVKAEIVKVQAEAAEKLGRQFNLPIDAIMVAFFGWGDDDAKALADTAGLPSEESEKIGSTEKKNMLSQIRSEVSRDTERARELGEMLDVMADAAEYLAEKPVRV